MTRNYASLLADARALAKIWKQARAYGDLKDQGDDVSDLGDAAAERILSQGEVQ